MTVSARSLANVRLKVTPALNVSRASQATAEAATDNSAFMTALRTKQQIDARLASQATAEAGVATTGLMNELRTKQSIAVEIAKPPPPYEGTAQVVRKPPLGNMSFCVGLAEEYSTGISILWRFDVCGTTHVPGVDGGVLMAASSRDGGVTWTRYRTIYSNGTANVTEGTRLGNMGGDRIGGILILQTAGVRTPYFIYSDDYFATVPTVVDISASITEPGPFAYYKAIPWLAADGGSDTQGFLWPIYGSAQDRALVIATDDNGATFSEIEINGPTPSGTVNEIVPLRLDDGRWMVFARSASTPGTPIYVITADSFDELPAATWVDTGIECGGNPFSAVLDDGKVYLSIIYRTLAGANYAGQRNIQIVYAEDAGDLYDAGGVFTDEPRFGHQFANRATGQVTPYFLGGRWLTTATVGESRLATGLPSRTQTVIISSEPRASLSDGNTTRLPPENLLFNPYFDQANCPTTGTAVATLTELADCNFSVSSGDTMDFALVDVPVSVRDFLPFRGGNGLQLTVSAQDGSCGLLNQIKGREGKEIIRRLSAQPYCTVGIVGYKNVIPDLQASVSIDAEGDASALVNYTANFPVAHSVNDGVWYSEVEVGVSGADTGVAPVTATFGEKAKLNVAFQTNASSTATFTTVVAGLSMSFNEAPVWPVTQRISQEYRGRMQNIVLANGANNNVFIDAGIVRVTGPTGAFSITGFDVPSHIVEFTLISTVAQALTISNLSASSTTANRIITNAGDVTTTNLGAFRFVRDRRSTTGSWLLCGKEL